MSRVAPTTIWEESNTRRVTSRAQQVYATDGWYLTNAADGDATFALDSAGRLTQTPEVMASAGRVFLLGDEGRVFMIGLPTTPITDAGYPVLSGSDFVGLSTTDRGDALEITSGDLTGVGTSGDSAVIVWNAGTDGYDWTG